MSQASTSVCSLYFESLIRRLPIPFVPSLSSRQHFTIMRNLISQPYYFVVCYLRILDFLILSLILKLHQQFMK